MSKTQSERIDGEAVLSSQLRGARTRTSNAFDKLSTPLAFAFLALTSQVASAQLSGNPAGLSPDTPGIEAAKPMNDATNNQDKLFVRQIALGNRAEVELGKLAQSKGSAVGVKDFASRMQKDHSASLDRAMKAGKPTKMDIPKDLDAEHKRVRDELNALSGAEFDKAYLTAQMQDHQKTANLLLWHLSYGQNADLIKYSADTLPDVLDHLEHAKREYAKLTETPPPR
jgi:putative membrane protein